MAEATVAGGGLDPRRCVLLWVIGPAQLLVVLNLTVMDIALPSAQRALHFPTVDRQEIRRFLLERAQPYPIRLVNWFMSK
jgi:hypothetical protein